MQTYGNEIFLKVRENVGKVIIGKEDILELIMIAIVADGHILLEDVPGTGKTKMAKAVAVSIEGIYKRIQFTPDLLPTDITGLSIYNQKEENFVFKEGPVFANILLADEINRATPRTQAGLLECMEEKQITVDGITYSLEEPFLVIATQNPIETAGTFPLPEAQIDRFMMKLSMGFPTEAEELQIINTYMKENPLETLKSVCFKQDIIKIREEAKNVFVHSLIKEYIVDIIQATRKADYIRVGISPRGTLALLHAAKSYACIQNRNYVIPEDIKKLAIPVLSHRLLLENYQDTEEKIINRILETIEVPTENFSRE